MCRFAHRIQALEIERNRLLGKVDPSACRGWIVRVQRGTDDTRSACRKRELKSIVRKALQKFADEVSVMDDSPMSIENGPPPICWQKAGVSPVPYAPGQVTSTAGPTFFVADLKIVDLTGVIQSIRTLLANSSA